MTVWKGLDITPETRAVLAIICGQYFRHSDAPAPARHCNLCGVAIMPGDIVIDTLIWRRTSWAHMCVVCALIYGTRGHGTHHHMETL